MLQLLTTQHVFVILSKDNEQNEEFRNVIDYSSVRECKSVRSTTVVRRNVRKRQSKRSRCSRYPCKKVKRYSQQEMKSIDCVQPLLLLRHSRHGRLRSARQIYKPIPANNSRKEMVLATAF